MRDVAFALATAADDADLRRLFAENAMGGEIEVSFRREPSYFQASRVQGGFVQVFVGRDRGTGEAVGVATRASRAGYLNGRAEEIGYLADMRLDRRYRGLTLPLRAFAELRRLHADRRVRLYFTVIAEGNEQALRSIASGRFGFPPYRDLGRLLSPAVNLLRRKPDLPARCEIVAATPALLPEMVACLNRNMARRQFAPSFRAEQFLNEDQAGSTPITDDGHGISYSRLDGFRLSDMLVAIRDGRVIGTLGRWDQSAFKQTVVTAYRGRMRAARPAWNTLSGLLGLPRFPPPGEAIRSFYAAFPCVDDNELPVFRALLRRLYNQSVGGDYAYFLLGLHEADPLAAALKDYTLTPFAGRLFAVHHDDGREAFEGLDGRVPYVELAML